MMLLLLAMLLTGVVPNPGPLLVSINEAAEMLGVSRRLTISLLDSGQLRSLKLGRRRMVPVAALHEFIENRLAG